MANNNSQILIGQEDAKKVYIEYGEYLKILKFSKAGASDGARGVLLGRREKDKIYVLKVIEALYYGDEGLESPAFSPQSWGRIMAEAKASYKDLHVVGQFSSHYSAKPIRMDYIMQEKYFSGKGDLLFVFDPTDNSEKLFEYTDREFAFLNGFYIFDKFENPINLNIREAILRPLLREYELRMRLFDDIKRKIKKHNYIYAILLIILMIFVLYNIIYSYQLEKKIVYYRENTQWNSELKT